MLIQSLPALSSVFVPASAPLFTDIRMVEAAPGVAQVQVKVIG